MGGAQAGGSSAAAQTRTPSRTCCSPGLRSCLSPSSRHRIFPHAPPPPLPRNTPAIPAPYLDSRRYVAAFREALAIDESSEWLRCSSLRALFFSLPPANRHLIQHFLEFAQRCAALCLSLRSAACQPWA
jgi:hypothetical protein